MTAAVLLLAALAAAAPAKSRHAHADPVAAEALVGSALARAEELLAAQKGQDAARVDALDRQAEALFSRLAPAGWRAAEPLGLAARDPRRPAKLRVLAVSFLIRLRDPAAYRPLHEVLVDAEQPADARAAAAHGIAALDVAAASKRRSLCAALAQDGLPRALLDDLLTHVSRLGCPHPAGLERAARLFGPKPAGKDLESVRLALSALSRSHGEPAALALLALLRRFPPRTPSRAAAIAALAPHREALSVPLKAQSWPVLRDALRSETEDRAGVLALLGLLSGFGPEAEPLLRPLLAHPDPEVLAEAAEALAARGDLSALPALEKAAEKAFEDPRFSPREGRPSPTLLLERVEKARDALRQLSTLRK